MARAKTTKKVKADAPTKDRKEAVHDDAPSFGDVKAELDKALGKPKRERGVLRYAAPADGKKVTALVARVRTAGGSASLCEAHDGRQLCVVDGPPSGLMDLVTYTAWQSKSMRRALDILDRDAGLQVADINYTEFVMLLDRPPKKAGEHAKRFAKIYRYMPGGDEKKIAAALMKRKYKAGS